MPKGGSDNVDYVVSLIRRIHRNRSIKELGRMFGHRKKGNVLGLTQTQLDFGWETHIRSYREGGSYCFWIAGLTLTARYPTPDIYVAKEYFPGTCPYRAAGGRLPASSVIDRPVRACARL